MRGESFSSLLSDGVFFFFFFFLFLLAASPPSDSPLPVSLLLVQEALGAPAVSQSAGLIRRSST